MAPLFRRKNALIVVFVAVFAIVLVAGTLIPPHFTSHMAILVDRERLDPLVTTTATSQMPADNSTAVTLEEINSEAELLQSADVLEKVVLATGLAGRKDSGPFEFLHRKRSQAERVARAVQDLAKALKVENKANSNLIEVSYSSTDAPLSRIVLYSLASTYLEKHAEVHRPPGTFDFFTKESESYRQALEASETRLRAFGKEQEGAAPDLVRSDLALQVANAVGQMHSTEETIAGDELRIRNDQEQMKTTPQRTATKQDTEAANLLLEQLGSALLAAQNKRIELGMKYDSSYPLVQEADQEIAQTKAAISRAENAPYINLETDRDPTYELLREDLAKTEVDLAVQRANLVAVKRSLQNMLTQMGDLNEKAITQQDLQRDVKANEDNYLLYLAKREQERTSDALDAARIANVSVAVPPNLPVIPVYGFRLILLIALAAACVLSIGITYVIDYFDSSFHTPAQVVDMLGIPVVVAMPKTAA
jgi:uncharacterized protein involved in exopolysaccharide biosynthesis